MSANLEAAIRQGWGLPDPLRLTPLAHGTNNLVRRVETPLCAYVLRVYGNHADPARLRFEHAVLAQLQAAGLPFAVPAPIPTAAGELFLRVMDARGEELATLTALIPGEHPRRDDLAQAEAGGEAIGRLDAALARITPPDRGAGVNWRSHGDLEHCHPLVPDPSAAFAELPLPDEARRALLARYGWLVERIPSLYATLPQQLAHEDCGPSNVLMAGERVTGILDFEFCARDLRVMDLTVALSWWPIARFGTGEEWPILRAVARGYARHVALTAAEMAALPALFHLRAYTSLVHRLGRHRQGLATQEDVIERADAASKREVWLATHGKRLIRTVGEGFSA